MANYANECTDQQRKNRERLMASLRLAARMGKKVNVSTVDMLALLVRKDALGTFTDKPKGPKDPAAAAEGYSVPDHFDEITTAEYVGRLGWKDTRANRMKAGEILRGLGFDKVRKMSNGVRRWVFVRD